MTHIRKPLLCELVADLIHPGMRDGDPHARPAALQLASEIVELVLDHTKVTAERREEVAQILWGHFDSNAEDEMTWEEMGESIRKKYYQVADEIGADLT